MVGDGLRDGISIALLKSLHVPLPRYEEQVEIGLYLMQKDLEINSGINEIVVTIEKLKEYRQALIFEAVTGKIDVRDIEIDS